MSSRANPHARGLPNFVNTSATQTPLASEVGLSRSHLHRKLKELTNQTTRDFIRNIRLKAAARLLSEKRHSISEVADMVGFNNLGNFATAFKQLYGMSSSQYRDSQQEDPECTP